MENKMRRNILIAAAVLTAAAVIILTVIGLAAENRDYEPASWVLKAYGNSVALYNDGKISDVFGEISLNELPEEDADFAERNRISDQRRGCAGNRGL